MTKKLILVALVGVCLSACSTGGNTTVNLTQSGGGAQSGTTAPSGTSPTTTTAEVPK
jgi:hypothetical protein